ncbi:hypothetical protein [Pimelobacter simplex]|uniref:hypothetical protein n=1 Tax=Nocardioides simplex TaxID=2045 RepID=UPI003AAE4C97
MAHRGYSLSDVRDRLVARGHPVSIAALSYWRSGPRTPKRRASLEALPELEAILGLEDGALSRTLPGDPGPAGQVAPFNAVLGLPDTDWVMGEDDLTRVSAQMVVDLGARREVTSIRIRQVAIALRDGVDGMTFFSAPSVVDGEPVVDASDGLRYRALAGGTIGVRRDHSKGMFSVRMDFDRPLALGEMTITEHEITSDGPGVWDDLDMALVAEHKLEDATVWVRFHPECLPAEAWVFFEESGLAHEWPADLSRGANVTYRQTDFGPGRLGVRWVW